MNQPTRSTRVSHSTLYRQAARVEDRRERIVRVAYDLFCRHGARAVGIDRIIAEADVAKTTLYRHFSSKDELVLAVLERREELWTRAWLLEEVERRAETPEARLLAIFDVLADWFGRRDFEGCLFINTLLESRPGTNPVGVASAAKLANVRAVVQQLAEEAGARHPEKLARQWQTLMSGAIVLACYGVPDAAGDARAVASLALAAES